MSRLEILANLDSLFGQRYAGYSLIDGARAKVQDVDAFTGYVPKVGDRVLIGRSPSLPNGFVGMVGTVTAVDPAPACCFVDLDDPAPQFRPMHCEPGICFYPGEVEAITDANGDRR